MSDLVEPNGTSPIVGAWDHPLLDPNLEDAKIVHSLDVLADVPGMGRAESAYRQKLRLKSWQYMTASTDTLFLAFVVGTAGFASNGFVYAAELDGGKVHKKFAITPLQMGTRVSPSSATGSHTFRTRGLGIAIENLDGGRRFAAHVDAKTEGGGQLTADLAFDSQPADEHLSLCVPLPGGRWNYTHKFAAFSVKGSVVVDGKTFDFKPDRSFGTMDFTKMYALRHAVWKWVALCGRTKHGNVVGLNLVDPTPDAPVSENAVWIDGKREPIAGVELSSQTDEGPSPWRVRAETIDISMKAVAHVSQRLDLPLVRHRLRHVIGAFSGRVRTANGRVHDLEHVIGIAEDYDTWW
ncbi:MAG: DUF2804 domain-containing protein [Deltaproteobacteria bacterium]|nr:DUF2804 domain-containing protein [Deltaproteobacteria bacterium]